MSGITLTDEQIDVYNELKLHKKFKGIVYVLNENRDAFDITKTFDPSDKLEDIAEFLPKDNCAFLVLDFEYKTDENPPRDTAKIILISWVPDSAPIKRKVPHSSSTEELKCVLTGIHKLIQASSASDITYEYIKGELK